MVTDVTLRIVLILWIVLGLSIDQMDVETAFLEGYLEEKELVYLKCPEGLNLNDDECLEMHCGMYGLVQSARIFFMSFSRHLTSDEVGFRQCMTDQCFFYKMGKKGPIILLLYVDDSACLGNKEDINETMKLISKKFTIKTEGGLNNFLGCDILREEGKDECWLLQPHLIKKLETNFEEKLKLQMQTKISGRKIPRDW